MSAPHLNTFLFTLWLCSRNIYLIFFLGISMFEGPQNTTEALLAWVSTSRFVTEVKSSTAGTEFQIISSFRENYSSEIMHNIYRYLHRLAFSVTFSSWEYYKIRKHKTKKTLGHCQNTIWLQYLKIFYYADYLSQHLLIPGAWPVSAAADITQCLVNIVTDPSVTRGNVTVSLVRPPLSLEDAGVVKLSPAINLKPNKPRLLQCLQHK